MDKAVAAAKIIALLGQELGLDFIHLKGLVSSHRAEELLHEPNLIKSEPALCNRLKDSSLVQQQLERLAAWGKAGLNIVSILESDYPALLSKIYDPPPILFYKGELTLHSNCVAIVGSRNADLEGFKIAEELARSLAERGVTIISGLALGIDTAAHKGALSSNRSGATVAVLGNGLSQIYPRQNERLADNIIALRGQIISQFEPDTPAYPSNFLNRNRVIAGLAQGTIVIQAGNRSGSLVTARYALEEGRDVLVVPGSIKNPRYEGSFRLLKQGAYLVTTADDVFEALPQLTKASEISPVRLINDPIIEALKISSPLHHDVLAAKVPEASDLAYKLLKFELDGVIERLPGNYWSLTSKVS